jgi:hypothetical protein
MFFGNVSMLAQRLSAVTRSATVRTCYVCGRETIRRLVIEPLLLPVCLDRHCALQAARLPDPHCSARLENGQVCGVRGAPQWTAGGASMCPHHLREFWSAQCAA